MSIHAGYYTLKDTLNDDETAITVCRVDEDSDEVEIMNYIPGYTRADVFGKNSRFMVLAGPWEPPQ